MLKDHDKNCEYKSDVDNDNNENNKKQAAACYGVPLHLLFQPDDLAVQGHVYK